MTHHCDAIAVLPVVLIRALVQTHVTVCRLVLLLLLAFGVGSVSKADFVSLSAVADTSLYENKPDSNLGAATLVAGQNYSGSPARALFRFDLSTIPSGATITGVDFSLSVVGQPNPDKFPSITSDFSLYRLLVDWGEGSGGVGVPTGTSAQSGDATWNDRHFGSSIPPIPSIPWTIPGGLSGTDYADSTSTTTTISNVGLYLWPSNATIVSDVQAWVDAPSSNYGFILISQSEGTQGTARRFSSREQPVGGTPPHLNITYSTVPEPGTFGMLLGGFLGLAGISQRKMRAAVKGSALLD